MSKHRISLMITVLSCMLLAVIATMGARSAAAQSSTSETRQLVNQNSVYIIGGSLTGTNSALVWDMAKLFDDGYNLRVLPIAGRGSLKTTEDILYLRGIDVGTVQADVLDFFTSLNIYPNIEHVLRYITALHDEEVHIVVRRGAANSVKELEGKKVNFGPSSSGTFMTASVVFDRLETTVDAFDESYDVGLDMLKNGELDAIVRVAGAPTSFLTGISVDEGLQLLPIPVTTIGGPYKAKRLTSEQYPGLIALGEEIDTVSIPSVLVAYNHPDGYRRDRVSKFVVTLAERLQELQAEGPFHPKWKEVDFSQKVSGWTRWDATSPDP